MIEPGIQSGRANGFHARPTNSCSRKRADTRAGVDRGQDEERLEHDREVIPVRHQPAHAGQAAEDVGHADGQRDGAAGPVRDVLADLRPAGPTG